MVLHLAEDATFRAFVLPARRDRFLTLLASSGRRRRALDALNHFTQWDPRFARAIVPSTDVLELLDRAGAPPHCHVVSNARHLDGRDMPLEDAIRDCEAFSFASVLCCVPGKLAFFYDEIMAPRGRLLLQRPHSAV